MSMFSGRLRYSAVIAPLMAALAATVSFAQETQLLPGPDRFWFMGPLSPFGPGANSSMDPIALELVTSTQKIIKLRIPRAYISSVTEPGKTQQSVITLAVYLPDYLPKVLADKAGHQTQGKSINGFRLRSKDEIAIYLKPALRGSDRAKVTSIKAHSMFGGEHKSGLGIYYRKQYKAGSYEPHPDKYSGHLIPIDRDDLSIRFNSSPKTGEMVGCTVQFNFNDDISIEASFSATNLAQYEQIMKAVSDLLSRLLV